VGSIAKPKILVDPDEKVDGVDGVEFESYFDLFTLSEKQMHEMTFKR
jgi:hypothetical protein